MKKNYERHSKLDAHREMILKYNNKGYSLEFICRKLEKLSVHCHRSTVLRFLSKKLKP